MLGEQLLDEVAVLLWNHPVKLRFQLRGIAFSSSLGGNHDIDAIRPVADLIVDPLELDLELLR